MSISYYDVTVPLFIKTLTNLKHFLEKGATLAKENGVLETNYLAMQLAPDMFPLRRQIQIATDNAKGTAARLSGQEPIKIEDRETTLAELTARIDLVIEHLKAYTPEQFADAANVKTSLPYFPGKYFTGHDYVIEYALPNFFFHVTTAYAIIRASGVPLGKADYVGALTMHDVV